MKTRKQVIFYRITGRKTVHISSEFVREYHIRRRNYSKYEREYFKLLSEKVNLHQCLNFKSSRFINP